MLTAVDVRVTGRVQGVSFRMRAHEEAARLGVAGWVSNEPDGSVAGHFEGPEEAVRSLVVWCREGPAYAAVAGVDAQPSAVGGHTAFEVR